MILCYRHWQEKRRERNNEIREDKERFGELHVCPAGLTACPDRGLWAGLMDAPTTPSSAFPQLSHLTPSLCEVSCSPRLKHTGVWEEDPVCTLTLHKDSKTAWELLRKALCHLDSWDILLYGMRLRPGNYALMIKASHWHPEQSEIRHT